MRREVADLAGVVLSPARRHDDARGSFAKGLDLHDGVSSGWTGRTEQVCLSRNERRGTIRGLHLQQPPHAETKLVWCVRGTLWDVLVDARPASPTYGDWAAVELDAAQPRTLLVPPGVAHGFQTLADDTEVVYLIEGRHVGSAARTVRWDDPGLAIDWPLPAGPLSDADREAAPWPPAP